MLAARGVAALLETTAAETALTERLLARPDGERLLTDLRHIGQRLHAAMTGRRLGIAGLRRVAARAIAQARVEARTDSTRRLETDADAVQMLTLHRARDWSSPSSTCPRPGTPSSRRRRRAVLRLHEQNANVLDVGGRQARVVRSGSAGPQPRRPGRTYG